MSDVEPDVHDLAVFHDVLLPLDLQAASVFDRLLGAVLHEDVVGDHLGSNEPSFEVRVDASGGLSGRSSVASWNERTLSLRSIASMTFAGTPMSTTWTFPTYVTPG